MTNQLFKTKFWIQVSLLNFCVVALAGVALRYKINFPLPYVNQKFLLHAHSHFAFNGWIALALMSLMINYLRQNNVTTSYKRYNQILTANCLTAYGMLISFTLQGYGFYSIALSTLSILVSYFFIFFMWRDLAKVKDVSYATVWFKGALLLLGFSSLGAFTLAYLMANHIMVQDYYFAAVYFFLHFQYNGWFLFAGFGLLFSFLHRRKILHSRYISKKFFIALSVTVIPTFFLSILWLRLPGVLRWTANVSAILQLAALFYFIKLILFIRKNLSASLSPVAKYLWIMASVAFSLKIILQLLSIIPVLSQLAFGFRPVVIGYLHLSFIGITSFFILGYFNEILIPLNLRLKSAGIWMFISGFVVQEFVLMLQGMEALQVEPFRYANVILFACAIVMLTGLIWIFSSLSNSKKLQTDNISLPDKELY